MFGFLFLWQLEYQDLRFYFFEDTIGSESKMGEKDKIGMELDKTWIGEELPEIFREPLFKNSD